MTTFDFDTQLAGFIVGAQKVINDHYAANLKSLTPPQLIIERGSKFARIVQQDSAQRSAWAFIDLRNGDILKCAGWKAPAKKARGTIMEDGFGVKYITYLGPAYLR